MIAYYYGCIGLPIQDVLEVTDFKRTIAATHTLCGRLALEAGFARTNTWCVLPVKLERQA